MPQYVSPVRHVQVVVVDGQPGSAQHVVPGNAVSSHADAAGDPVDVNAEHEHPSGSAWHVTAVYVLEHARGALAARSAPTRARTTAPIHLSVTAVTAVVNRRTCEHDAMDLATIPFFERLSGCKSVLLAGAGGGYDVFAGLPLYFALRARGVEAHLANLSFSRVDTVSGHRPAPNVVAVEPDSDGPAGYFPEKHLSAWLREQGERPRVFAFDKTGVVHLRAAYDALVKELGVDAIVLVDGGTDSLLRGDEAGLGTPSEDMASIAAVDDVDVPTKLLASIGFGVDAFHGVCHAQVLETVAALTRDGGYLGSFALLPQMREFALYKSAVDAAHAATHARPSIVNASIISAVEGDFGDVHRIERTSGSKLWINPLMAMYFTFELGTVARRVSYLPRLKTTQTIFEVSALIDGYQRTCDSLRPWTSIPI